MLTPLLATESVIGSAYVGKIIALIDQATVSVDVLMFEWRWYFNNPHCDVSLINHAFVRAVRRGVKVRAIVNFRAVLDDLAKVGIVAKAWNSRKLMHSKAIVLDSEVLVTGSHNLTLNAMRDNVESSLVTCETQAVQSMHEYFNSLWSSL